MAQPNVLASRVSGGQSEFPMHPRIPRLTVGRLLSEKQIGLHHIAPDCPLIDAFKALVDKSLEAILIMDAGRAVGVFSLRNYARVAAMAEISSMKLPVSGVMTPCKCVVSPNDSAQTCLQLMSESNLQFIPVQENDCPIALLSKDDLLSEMVLTYEKIFRESALDQQLLFLRGAYSC